MFKKYVMVYLIIIMSIFIVPMSSMAQVVNKHGEDPDPGTAEPYIEEAIAAGMELVGESTYKLGDGRNTRTYGKTMDCSSFMHYIFNKGPGMLLLNDSTAHAGTGTDGEPAVTTRSMQSGMDVIDNVKLDDIVRGDLVLFRTHVGIYLGDGIMLNDATSAGVSLADISPGSYWNAEYIGKVIKVKEDGKGVTLKEGADIDSSEGDKEGTKEEGSKVKKGDSKKEGRTGPATAKGLEDLVEKKQVTNKAGVDDGQGVLGADLRNNMYTLSLWAYDITIIISVYASIAFFLYSTVGVIFYVAIQPGSALKKDEKREKGIADALGVGVDYTKEGKKEVFKQLIFSSIIVVIFITGVYIDLMALFFKAIDVLGIF